MARSAMALALLKLLLIAAGAYLGIALLVWIAQERLMFMPQPVAGEVRPPAGWHLEEVTLVTRDGTRIAGALVLPPVKPAPLVIYFGGNAEEVTQAAAEAAEDYGLRALLLVNYRGYGRSAGTPGERSLVSDALELYDWAARHPAIDAGRIAVHGRSLGSGVAVPLAAARPVRCVVLTSPFASALEVAREIYGWLPVGWLMRHPFDSGKLAPSVKAPLLVLVGDADTIIRPHHSTRLATLWGGNVDRTELRGFGHNDLHLHPAYGAAIRAFLDKNL